MTKNFYMRYNNYCISCTYYCASQIILNESQMNVKVIDYTTRDAAVLGAKISFKWR